MKGGKLGMERLVMRTGQREADERLDACFGHLGEIKGMEAN